MVHGIFKYLFSAEEDQGDKITDYKCSECNMFFQAKCALTNHKKTHGPQYPCDYPGCNISFISCRTLIEHKRTVHERLEPYCPFCGLSFKYAYNIRKHFARKHPHEDISALMYHCSGKS